MNKEQAKENISELVKKYQRIAEAGKIKSYNEAQTRNEFIEPLFAFLGWDMRNTRNDNEVTTEEAISGSRVDLAFRINGISKFFLEAKSLKSDLNIESYARQAINYSWNKGVNWAALTDFEGIKIFNVNAKSKSLRDKMVFEISYDEYMQDFERLWLLSKESFEKNALDVYAEKHGKKSKSLAVNDKLFDDLKQAREILTKSFNAWKGYWNKNKDIDQETLDEGVQRILDRLVFIRVLEDRKLEEAILRPIVREWDKDRSNNKQLFQMLTEKFRELDDIYNSSLFAKHACEDWEEYDDATKKAIELLYGNDVYEYNFKEIPADILGGVYESYLGYIAQKPIEFETKKKSEKLSKSKDKKDLKIKSRKKRKEQGIYYTPNFIVDYIIKNTLGKKLEEIKNINDLKKIKILDPACGSGSFLVKALETVNEKYKDFNNPGDQYTKSGILLGNIYGVDLDPQAVELAKLNLLIGALDQKAKLPNLTDNVRVGNSLISGSEKELEKHFGKDWRDKKPFNWEEEFPFCHSREDGNPEDGFDVIIGNPPYIRVDNLNKDDKDCWKEIFKTSKGKYDLYYLFIEKSISLLKNGGVLGFIIPNKFCVADSAKELRKLILELSVSCKFFSVSKLDIFKDASNYPVVLLLTKGGGKQKIEFSFAENEKEIIDEKYISYPIDKDEFDFLPSKIIPVNAKEEDLKIVINLIKKEGKFSEYLKISEGLRVPEKYESKNSDKFGIVKQYQFSRYSKIKDGSFISEDNLNKVISKKSNRFSNILKDKIIIAEDALCVTATLDENKNVPQGGVYFGTLIDSKIPIKYLLALLNSKVLSFVYKTLFGGMHMGGGYLRYRTSFLEQLPIKIANRKEQEALIKLVDKILALNKNLESTLENSDKWNVVKKEIGKVDGEIEEKVFELYGLGEDEKGIIENN